MVYESYRNQHTTSRESEVVQTPPWQDEAIDTSHYLDHDFLSPEQATLANAFEIFELRPLTFDSRQTTCRGATESNKDLPVSIHRLAKPYWRPLCLRSASFFAFIIAFLLMIITLAVLYSYSQIHQGLSTVHTSYHYLWTYGPTAVLTLIAAFWGQVEYRIKQLQPWRNMSMKPQSAATSLLLDYISGLNIVTLFCATKASHYPVAFAVLASFLIKGLTIFSTGLFATQWATITAVNTTLTANTQFDATAYDWINVDGRPASIVYGALALNLSYPSGTTRHLAFQTLSDPNSNNATLYGEVDAFSASLNCEEAELTILNLTIQPSGGNDPQLNPRWMLNISSSGCTVANYPLTGTGAASEDVIPANATWTNPWAFAQAVECAEATSPMSRDWLLITMGEEQYKYTYSGASNATLNVTLPEEFTISSSTSLLCKSNHTISRAKLTTSSPSTGQPPLVQLLEPGPTNVYEPAGLQSWNIMRGVLSSVQMSTIGVANPQTEAPRNADAFFKLLYSLASKDPGLQPWMDGPALAETANSLYGSIAAQVASQHLFVSASNDIVGTSVSNQQRLFVRVLSFALMEVFLTLNLFIALWLCLTFRKGMVTRDPGSIGGLATLLSRSPDVANLLHGHGGSTLEAISEQLGGHQYYSTTGQDHDMATYGLRTRLRRVRGEQEAKGRVDCSHENVIWWEPMAVRVSFQIMALVMLLGLIAALEILLMTSQSKDGLADVDSQSYVHYAWTYLPALVMISVQLLFSAVDFNLKLFSPYSCLARVTAPSTHGLFDSLLNKVALYELWTTVRQKQFLIFTSTLATILAPVLTITVSGLYTAERFTRDVSVHQTTDWTWNSSAYVNGTLLANIYRDYNQNAPSNFGLDIVTTLIIESNLSYTPWTFGELALPIVEVLPWLPRSNALFGNANGSLSITLPAIRGSLNCTIISHEETRVTYFTSGGAGSVNDSYVAIFNASMPDGCGNNCVDWSQQDEYSSEKGFCMNISFALPSNTFIGDDSQARYFGWFTDLTNSQTDPWCPEWGFVFGRATASVVEDYTWVTCSTNAEQVQADVSFTLPDYSIPASSPPRAIESTATIINGPIGLVLNTIYIGPNSVLDEDVGKNTFTESVTFYNTSDPQDFDAFFSALIYGRDGVSPNTLLGEANAPRLVEAIQHLFRLIIAQDLNVNHRTPNYVDPNSGLQTKPVDIPLTGTFTSTSALRLKQNAVSTYILEGILAALATCLLITFCLMDTKKVLPNNPCSIAAAASLLAGSEMLSKDVIPAGSEWLSNKELRNRGVFEGYLFSLGWWGEGDRRRYGIDIGQAEKMKST